MHGHCDKSGPKYLAGVIVVCEAIDHRTCCILSQLHDILMGKQAGHDELVVSAGQPGMIAFDYISPSS